MTETEAFFSRRFRDARALFRQAAEERGFSIHSYSHPLQGFDGEALATDVVRIGPQDARQLLVLISGVHGVELYAGSGCQIDMLKSVSNNALPADTALLLVHAINPWGAAHFRRNTETNADLARNFIGPDEMPAGNDAYETIHEVICNPDRDKVQAGFQRLAGELGEMGFIRALMGGQYKHPTGFSWGGDGPVWSQVTIQDILARETQSAEDVTIVEYHSGLGPYGYGMAVCMQAGLALERSRKLFGRWLVAPRSAPGETHGATGHTTDGYTRFLVGKRLSSIVLEFGTYPPSVSLPVLLDDHWLTFHGDVDTARDIHARNLEMHAPDDPEWRRAICERSRQVIRQTLASYR